MSATAESDRTTELIVERLAGDRSSRRDIDGTRAITACELKLGDTRLQPHARHLTGLELLRDPAHAVDDLDRPVAEQLYDGIAALAHDEQIGALAITERGHGNPWPGRGERLRRQRSFGEHGRKDERGSEHSGLDAQQLATRGKCPPRASASMRQAESSSNDKQR